MRPGESVSIGPLQLIAAGPEAGPFTPPGRHALVLALTSCEARQGGQEVSLAAGEWALCAPDRPLCFTAALRLALLPPDWPVSPSALLRRFPAEIALNRIVFSLFRALFEEAGSLTSPCGEELARALLHVLDRTIAEAMPDADARRSLSARVRDFIEWHIRDPDLAPRTIAQALHCSPRNVHRAFSGSGETVGQYVLRRRLERCFADLSLAGGARRPVAQIAFSWGFNNAAHFSRVFKKQFGRAPRTCRAAPVSGAAGGWIDGKESATFQQVALGEIEPWQGKTRPPRVQEIKPPNQR